MSKLAATGLALILSCAAAQAAPAADRAATRMADATPVVQPAAAIQGEDDGAVCNRARRRLWVEGEGWVVRRITTCR